MPGNYTLQVGLASANNARLEVHQFISSIIDLFFFFFVSVMRMSEWLWKLTNFLYGDDQVRFNDLNAKLPHFSTGLKGDDNAIARHGIHGLYRLHTIAVGSNHLVNGKNTIYLTQSKGISPFMGVMYDYVRLESPPIKSTWLCRELVEEEDI